MCVGSADPIAAGGVRTITMVTMVARGGGIDLGAGAGIARGAGTGGGVGTGVGAAGNSARVTLIQLTSVGELTAYPFISFPKALGSSAAPLLSKGHLLLSGMSRGGVLRSPVVLQ
jgi:hypothetical protein